MGLPDNFSAKAFSRAHDGPAPEAERYANEKATSLMAHLRAIADLLIRVRADIEILGGPEHYQNENAYTYQDVLTVLGELLPDVSKSVRYDAYRAALAEWEEMQ